jgi:putative SOS response-associated peptidase YedK
MGPPALLNKGAVQARKQINAWSETAATSGMFRAALKSRRAIVPCDAFYERRTMRGGAKEPFAIGRRKRAPVVETGNDSFRFKQRKKQPKAG